MRLRRLGLLLGAWYFGKRLMQNRRARRSLRRLFGGRRGFLQRRFAF